MSYLSQYSPRHNSYLVVTYLSDSVINNTFLTSNSLKISIKENIFLSVYIDSSYYNLGLKLIISILFLIYFLFILFLELGLGLE